MLLVLNAESSDLTGAPTGGEDNIDGPIFRGSESPSPDGPDAGMGFTAFPWAFY
jgi:hypothetical protein